MQRAFYIQSTKDIYYAATSGTTMTVFSKEDEQGNITWAKSYNPLFIYQKGFVVADDGSKMFAIQEQDPTSVKIF